MDANPSGAICVFDGPTYPVFLVSARAGAATESHLAGFSCSAGICGALAYVAAATLGGFAGCADALGFSAS